MDEKLRNALVAARDGDEAKARLILAEFLRSEPENVPAWVLLSKVAATDVQKAAFLRKALELDPDHVYARQALEQLGQAPAPIIAGDTASPVERDESPPPADAAPPVVQEPITPFHPELSEEELDDDGYFEESGFDEDFFEDDFLGEASLEEDVVEELEDQEDSTWEISDEAADFDVQATGDTIPPWVEADSPMVEAPSPSAPSTSTEFDDDEVDDELPEWLREEGADDWLDEETEAKFAEAASEDTMLEDQTASEKAARLSAAMAMESPPVADSDEEGSRGWLLMLLLVIAAVIFLMLVYAVLRVL